MPKKQEKKEEKIVDSKEDSELEELIEDSVEEQELSEITENIPEEILVDEIKFQEFLQTDSSAPSLEQVAGEQELNARFFATGQMQRGEEEQEAFRYDEQATQDEPKYQGDYSSVEQNVERTDISQAGRQDPFKSRIQEAGFVSSHENNNSQRQETYQDPKQIDTNQAGRDDPFKTNLPEVGEKRSEYEELK